MLVRGGVVLLVASATLFLACPGRLENPERFTGGGTGGGSGGGAGGGSASCTLDVPTDIFYAKCGFSGCHAGAANNGINLSEDAGTGESVAQRLRANASAGCGMQPYYVFMKEKVRPDPPCGFQMPQGIPLTAAELSCLDQYLDGVADGGM